jgi:hypothetical protein
VNIDGGRREIDTAPALSAELERDRERDRLVRRLALDIVGEIGIQPLLGDVDARKINRTLQSRDGERSIRRHGACDGGL